MALSDGGKGSTIIEIGCDNVFGELLTAVDPGHLKDSSIAVYLAVNLFVFILKNHLMLVPLPVSSCMHVLVVPYPVFLPAIRVVMSMWACWESGRVSNQLHQSHYSLQHVCLSICLHLA